MTKNPKKLLNSSKARKSSTKAMAKKPAAVKLAHPSSPLRHFRLVKHAHSGKVIHHRHSSHAVLMLLLVFVGLFMFITQQLSSASSGTVTVGAIVNGPPPTVGATITSPADQAIIVNQTLVAVSGICSPSTFVVVKTNNTLAGSTNCTIAGIFLLTLDLPLGQNVLTALNFDNANQPGPGTPSVTITLVQETIEGEIPIVPVPPLAPGPTLPENPSIIPGLPGITGRECDAFVPSQESLAGGKLSVAVVCIPRILEKNKFYTMGVIVRGGLPPYALNIQFGSDDPDALVSIQKSGYNKIKFRYTAAGAFNIKLNLSDSTGATTTVETAVQVNGVGKPIITAIGEALSPSAWFTSPVPLYVVAVLVTLAFWGGDIFDRRYGARKARGRSTKRPA